MQQIPFDLEIYRNQMRKFINGDPDENIFWDALNFSTEAHDDQWRRSGDAYILHPCSVAKILAEELDIVHPEILAAALLHDTVEDVEAVTTAVVGDRFGSYVQAIVDGCTKVTHFTGDKQTHSKLIHRKIFSGAALRPEVMLVKLADRLHNLRTLQAMPRRKRQKIAEETLDIYAPLATAFGLFNLKREMYNLALSFKFPKQGSKLIHYIENLKDSSLAREVVQTLSEEAREKRLGSEVDVRVKELWAYYDYNNGILLKQIDFPYEILIVVGDTQDCYEALGVVNQTFRPIPRTIRDFIANPKPTGYQGLHARAIIKGQKFLFKIRTENMARRAQRGIFRNWSSKSGKQQGFINEIKEMFDVLGSDESVSYRDVIAASGKKEIYTYTPQGDLICLPINSTVLDFAFRVHTDIGKTCLGAMVANKRKKPSDILHDGDVARIIRSAQPVQFDQHTYDECQTARSRAELAKGFRVRRRMVTREIGSSTLRQEMQRYDLPLNLLENTKMQAILDFFSLQNLDELYQNIGEGRLRLHDIFARFRQLLVFGGLPPVPQSEPCNKIELTMLDPVSVKLSSCCKPNPTSDDNCALLTQERVSVHRKDCFRLKELKFKRESIVDISWKLTETPVLQRQSIHVLEASRQRLMMITGVAPEEMKIIKISMLSSAPTQTPAWELIFTAGNLSVLKRILKHFSKSGINYEFDFDY